MEETPKPRYHLPHVCAYAGWSQDTQVDGVPHVHRFLQEASTGGRGYTAEKGNIDIIVQVTQVNTTF